MTHSLPLSMIAAVIAIGLFASSCSSTDGKNSAKQNFEIPAIVDRNDANIPDTEREQLLTSYDNAITAIKKENKVFFVME